MRWINDLISDLRFAVRGILRNPGFCAVAILTIALGIGANTAVFSLAQKLLLEKLPVHRPDQLVELDCIDRTNPEEGQCDASWPGFHMYEENAPLLSGLFAYSSIPDLNIVISKDDARLASAMLASGNMYNVLGVSPLRGRLLNSGDDKKDAPAVAVLSYSFWRERFSSDAGVVGQTIRLNGHPVTIAGVTPDGFRGIALGEPPDITLPMGSATDVFLRPGSLDSGTNWWLKIMGRRKDGVSTEQVQAALAPVFQRTVEHMIASAGPEDGPQYRESLKNYEFRVRPSARGGFSELRSDLERPLLVLIGLAGLVLLIACANLAGMFLSRTSARRHEIAVRFSLGAGRLRLARQFWTESLLLSAAGGTIGLFLALWSGPLLLKMASGERALRSVDLSPDLKILLFAGAAITLTGLLIGAGPALGLSIAPAEAIRTARASRKTSGLSRFLMPAQVMLATLLLVGAGLFVRTLDNIRNVELGYRSERLITLTTSPGLAGYDEARRSAYWSELTARLAALPGVEAVTLSEDPIGKLNITTQVDAPGFESASPRERSTGQKRVGPRFVQTSGMTLVQGSDFSIADADSPRRVAIVNVSFAQYFFQTIDVTGRQFPFRFGPAQVPLTIVGVVADARDRNPRKAPERVIYTLTPARLFGSAAVGVRTNSSAGPLLGNIRAAVTQVDPKVPMRELRTLEDQIDETLGRDRLLATLGTFFGVLALLLAAIGLYGLLAGSVARRTREMGIRMALGARREGIAWLVLHEGLTLTVVGVASGLGLGLILTRYIETQLFEIAPNDPLTLAGAAAVLVTVAAVASLLPARRAAAVDPIVALSHE